jgi:hypothetical protein
MARWISGASLGAALILGCVAAAFLVASLVGVLLNPHLNARIFLPIVAVIAGAFILIAGFWWSFARHHGWTEMLGSLALIEILVAGLIIFFDAPFIDAFFGVNLCLGAPWLVAAGSSEIFKSRSPG